MMYSLIRPLLFRLDAETAHGLTLSALDWSHRAGLSRLLVAHASDAQPVETMGLRFPNAIGLAAGLDKNGEHIDALASLGFGFIEVGTVTPRPQPGNPRPRLFRLPQAQAIINRMGFNNHGVEALVKRVRAARYRGILGINIGKNFDTPIEKAVDDYIACLRAVYEHASYVTINISSPNTKNLRQLQQTSELGSLLSALKQEQHALYARTQRPVPLVVKIAPDLEEEQLSAIARLFLELELEGVIATNTTLSRDGVELEPNGREQGGLSGSPLTLKSTHVLRVLCRELNGKIPVIGSGGVMSGADAVSKIEAGAKLVQLYSGLIYRGPDLVTETIRAVSHFAKQA